MDLRERTGTPDKRLKPRRWFQTRVCFNGHEVPSTHLRVVQIFGASVVVCTSECEEQAYRKIERRVKEALAGSPRS